MVFRRGQMAVNRSVALDTASMLQLPVHSKMIASVYFRQEDGQLILRFKNGEERLFAGVPYEQALAISQSASPGRYYAEHIREQYRRVAA